MDCIVVMRITHNRWKCQAQAKHCEKKLANLHSATAKKKDEVTIDRLFFQKKPETIKTFNTGFQGEIPRFNPSHKLSHQPLYNWGWE